MPATAPPSPEALYDAAIAPAWRLARCLYHDQQRAEVAIVHAFAGLAHHWPRDLAEGRLRVLALLSDQAARRTDATPAA